MVRTLKRAIGVDGAMLAGWIQESAAYSTGFCLVVRRAFHSCFKSKCLTRLVSEHRSRSEFIFMPHMFMYVHVCLRMYIFL